MGMKTPLGLESPAMPHITVNHTHVNALGHGMIGQPVKNRGGLEHHHGVTHKSTWIQRANARPLVITRHAS